MSSSSSSFQPSTDGSATEQQQPQQPQVKLVDIEVKDEVVALNLIVSFLNLAQRRGAFTIDESSKLWECIRKFQKP
jgi:hypothetical protein